MHALCHQAMLQSQRLQAMCPMLGDICLLVLDHVEVSTVQGRAAQLGLDRNGLVAIGLHPTHRSNEQHERMFGSRTLRGRAPISLSANRCRRVLVENLSARGLAGINLEILPSPTYYRQQFRNLCFCLTLIGRPISLSSVAALRQRAIVTSLCHAPGTQSAWAGRRRRTSTSA